MVASPTGASRRSPAVLRLLLAVLLALGSAVLVGPEPAAADSTRSRQWQLGFLRAENAWRSSAGSGVTVAVIDSGVDADHPDLAGQVLKGVDFVDGSTDGRADYVGHGTSVAALIAGRGDDDDGVLGLAYQAKILPIRVLDRQNQYNSSETVAKAVRWAADHGAKVINLSLGSADQAPTLTDALAYAMDKDVVVVACDGNLSNNRGTRVWHPARQPGVVAVSGVVRSGRFWEGSLRGPETVLSAPAADITAAHPQQSYWNVQGTSFAAPLVAASAALVRSRFPRMSAAGVINRLIRTAWDLGPDGRDPQFGYGVVNPAKALTADVPAVSTNPLLAPPPTNEGGQRTQAPDVTPSDSPGAPRGVDGPPSVGPAGDAYRTGVVLGLAALSATAGFLFVALVVVGALLLRRRPAPAGSRPGWPPTTPRAGPSPPPPGAPAPPPRPGWPPGSGR
jgi:type VII secretion-associated serine protease mycosin